MLPCICYFELRFWCCFPCFCLLKTSCLLNYLREFPPPCSLITSCSLNYFERIFPPVCLLHPVLLIDSSEYLVSIQYQFECIQFFFNKLLISLNVFKRHSIPLHFATLNEAISSFLVPILEQVQTCVEPKSLYISCIVRYLYGAVGRSENPGLPVVIRWA